MGCSDRISVIKKFREPAGFSVPFSSKEIRPKIVSSIGCVICINNSLIRAAKNLKLFQPNMVLMEPLMIETLGKKPEDAKGLPPQIVKKEICGEQLHTICSGDGYFYGKQNLKKRLP